MILVPSELSEAQSAQDSSAIVNLTPIRILEGCLRRGNHVVERRSAPAVISSISAPHELRARSNRLRRIPPGDARHQGRSLSRPGSASQGRSSADGIDDGMPFEGAVSVRNGPSRDTERKALRACRRVSGPVSKSG